MRITAAGSRWPIGLPGSLLCPDQVESFTPCIVTHYRREAAIGWHTDAPRFGEVIMGISLGAPGRMPFRAGRRGGACRETILQAGSLYVMSGPARREYQPRAVPATGDRWSLAFHCASASGSRIRCILPLATASARHALMDHLDDVHAARDGRVSSRLPSTGAPPAPAVRRCGDAIGDLIAHG